MIPLLLRGPAGCGKTFRCLAEIADVLRAEPEGPPLILLAPRQATYQLERQILAMDGIEGFTRLRVLSFQRLADFVFATTGSRPPKLLEEQGRVMVLRAILGRRRDSLRMYGKGVHKEALAQELGLLWREVCEHRVGPSGFRSAAERVQNPRLKAKLLDFADVFEDYAAWLAERGLRDGDELLDLAADAALKGPMPSIAGLWMDGFAQMTPQERRLLNAVLRSCERATLAFCLPEKIEGDCFSMWGGVARLYGQLKADLTQVFGAVDESLLPRRKSNGRFAGPLSHLEEGWGSQLVFDQAQECVRLAKCSNPEAEAVFVAREILKFARAGGRFREAAVLVRSLDGAHEVLGRVFRRYSIPFFMDRRQAVAHHPLAELTRAALRTIALGWRSGELFCALKTGLIGIEPTQLDWFENMALARGWHGEVWRKKLKCGTKASDWDVERVEEIRIAALSPIFRLEKRLGAVPNGTELAKALREFWNELRVEEALTLWAEQAHEATHTTVWTQVDEWLKSIELAFASESMNLTEWLGIVEAGLASLTVGLIPPALDQTLIGAVDRSRNPDLKAVFLVGMNEGIFPRPGKERLLINDAERLALAEAGVHLGLTSLWDLGAEQFYGYIACTRGREHLTVTYSETDSGGQPLNPSVFVRRLQRIFPKLEVKEFRTPEWRDAEAPHELNRIVFAAARQGETSPLSNWEILRNTWERAQASLIGDDQRLRPEIVEGLYGKTLRTSVSRLEQFAMCPFRFFVSSGLRAQERILFELDRREEGSFLHELLAEFHREVEKLRKKWRDVTYEEAEGLIQKISAELRVKFQEGLAEATPANRFRAEARTAAALEFLKVYLELLKDCEFSPRHVEWGFGLDQAPLPVWVVEVDSERRLEFAGRIDRVDVWVNEATQQCYVAVFDYKSSKRELDRTLVEAAVQQQLPAYLAALQKVGQFEYPPRPAGAFYVNLKLKVSSGPRGEVKPVELKQSGVFDWSLIEKFDSKANGLLFDYTKRGPTAGGALRAMNSADFSELLEGTEARLRELGERIFDGEISMDPYRHKKDTPCERCFYMGICRIDPWTHSYRAL